MSPNRHRRRPPPPESPAAAAVLLALAAAGCPSPEPEPEPDPGPAYQGLDPAVPAGPAEARAGEVRPGDGAAALFSGIAAEGKPGDFKIYNDRVQFIIQGPYHSHGYVETGGNVIDADIVRPASVLGRDMLDDLFLSFGIGRLFDAGSVTVLADGSDGQSAIVRAEGTDVDWSFIAGAVESTEPIVLPQDVRMVRDYELAPGSWSLKITTTFTAEGSQPAHFNPTDGFMGSGEDLWAWAAGNGMAGMGGGDTVEALGGVGKWGEAAFSLWSPDGPLDPLSIQDLLGGAGLVAVTAGWLDLEPGQSLSTVRYLSLAPDTATLEAERLREMGSPLGTVSGTVTDAATGLGIEGVRVHFVEPGTEGGRWVAGFAISGADGSYAAELPPGNWDAWAVAHSLGERTDLPDGAGRYGPFAEESVNAWQLGVLAGTGAADPLPFAADRPVAGPVALELSDGGAASADFAMEPSARLRVVVTDGSGAPLPAIAEVRCTTAGEPCGQGPEGLHSAFGLSDNPSRMTWLWTADGTMETSIIPGTYDIEFAHSWRHGRVTVQGLLVAPDAMTQASASLGELLPRGGWLAMDSHLHAAPSSDGTLPMEDRLLVCAAAGVELPVNTDHDRQADYRPLADALALGGTLQIVPGVEVSPVLRGHFNLFPVEPEPQSLVNGGAEPWWVVPGSTDELLARVRSTGTGDSVLQVNHGRGTGMMDFAEWDPTGGVPMNPSFWSWDFDVFELINGRGNGNWEEERADWFSWLNQGEKRVPTGVSDSHGRTSPCGYGRTDVYLGTDDPAAVTGAALAEAIRAGHVVAAGGLTLRATLAGEGGEDPGLPGDTVTGGTATLSAVVSGPDWIVPDVLRVYRNGVLLSEEAIAGPAAGTTWAERSWAVEAVEGVDSWFVVEARGSQGLGGPWGSAVPFAITNALFLDADGDGWQGPGAWRGLAPVPVRKLKADRYLCAN
jgi:hypothetical protein